MKDDETQYRLGELCLEDKGTEQDMEQALSHYCASADMGCTNFL